MNYTYHDEMYRNEKSGREKVEFDMRKVAFKTTNTRFNDIAATRRITYWTFRSILPLIECAIDILLCKPSEVRSICICIHKQVHALDAEKNIEPFF